MNPIGHGDNVIVFVPTTKAAGDTGLCCQLYFDAYLTATTLGRASIC